MQITEQISIRKSSDDDVIIRNKLNDHILYLQQEIRKRDEMLEASDFEEDDFDSSLGDDDEEDVMERKLAEELVDDHGPDLSDSDGSGNVVPRIQTNNFMSVVEPHVAQNDTP